MNSFIILSLATILYTNNPTKEYNRKLGMLESGGNYQAVNQYGYLGKYQFGRRALIDLGFISNKLKGKYVWLGKYGITSTKKFLVNNKVQELTIKEWNNILDSRLRNCGASMFIGKKFHGITLSWGSIRGGSHLLGATYMCQFLKGKRSVGRDGNGTSVLFYMRALN